MLFQKHQNTAYVNNDILLACYAADPSRANLNRLACNNLGLVFKQAAKFNRDAATFDDLVSEGSLGLILAIKKFDPKHNTKFSTLATHYIRGYMLSFLFTEKFMIRNKNENLYYDVMKAKNELMENGLPISAETLQQLCPKYTTETIEKYLTSLEEMKQTISVRNDEDRNSSNQDYDEFSPQDNMEILSPEDIVSQCQIRNWFQEVVNEFLNKLEIREFKIFHHRILADEPLSAEEIGLLVGLSRQGVLNIEKRLNIRLAQFIKSREYQKKVLSQRRKPNSMRLGMTT